MIVQRRIVDAGIIRTETSSSLRERCLELHREVYAVLRRSFFDPDRGRSPPCLAVVECPSGAGRDPSRLDAIAKLHAAYGAIVTGIGASAPTDTIDVSVQAWTRHFPKVDRAKSGRVQLAASVYGLETSEIGPKGTAGDIADALLLAYWGEQTFRPREPRVTVVAFDPSIAKTGYAVIRRETKGPKHGTQQDRGRR